MSVAARLRRLPVDNQVRRIARHAVVARRYMGLRQSDVVLVSYPKSGSTWLRFVLVTALSGDEMDFDLVRRMSPPLGAHRSGPAVLPNGGRLVKSHEQPPSFARSRKGLRCLWLVRDGRDVAISYFFHQLRRKEIPDDLLAFVARFLDGAIGPYGSWQAHTGSWLDFLDEEGGSVTLVRYEDLLADPLATLSRISDELDLNLSNDAISSGVSRSTPESMRAKEASSGILRASTARSDISFVREARAGAWREQLSTAMLERFDSALGPELKRLGYPLAGEQGGTA